jgi:hypothetical protein
MVSFSSFIKVILPKKLLLKIPIQTLIKATETEEATCASARVCVVRG